MAYRWARELDPRKHCKIPGFPPQWNIVCTYLDQLDLKLKHFNKLKSTIHERHDCPEWVALIAEVANAGLGQFLAPLKFQLGHRTFYTLVSRFLEYEVSLQEILNKAEKEGWSAERTWGEALDLVIDYRGHISMTRPLPYNVEGYMLVSSGWEKALQQQIMLNFPPHSE